MQKKPGKTFAPLNGIRILDISHVLAGPFATYQLGLLGADVIRVERIAGDDFVRYHGGTADMKAAGLGASFLSQNASKKSVSLDLKSDQGKAIFLRLATGADVIMENFRPGVVDRLGVGFDAIKAVKPDIIYCSLSGYGQRGPLANAPAYDHILQGISGMMAMTGEPGSGPMRVGFPVVDYIAGQAAVNAILAALMQRNQDNSPRHLEISMLGSLISLLGAYSIDWETTGNLRRLEGNKAFSGSPFSDCFRTSDGLVVVTANTIAQAYAICGCLGAQDLVPLVDRMAGGETLTDSQTAMISEYLKQRFATSGSVEMEQQLTKAQVPAAKVRDLGEILQHPQTATLPVMRNLNIPELNKEVPVPALAFESQGEEFGELRPAPTLGRDTIEVLMEAGYTRSEVDGFLQSGVASSGRG
ncbi:MAG: CoA transferase [Rhodospirillales bacterium]